MNRRGFLARLAAGAAAAVGATAIVQALTPPPPFVFTELHSLSADTYVKWGGQETFWDVVTLPPMAWEDAKDWGVITSA